MAADHLPQNATLPDQPIPQPPDSEHLPLHRDPLAILSDIEHDLAAIHVAQMTAFAAYVFAKVSR